MQKEKSGKMGSRTFTRKKLAQRPTAQGVYNFEKEALKYENKIHVIMKRFGYDQQTIFGKCKITQLGWSFRTDAPLSPPWLRYW